MPCIEWRSLRRLTGRWMSSAVAFCAALLAGCATGPASPPAPVSTSKPVPVPVPAPPAAVARAPAPSAAAGAPGPVRLPTPGVVRSASELHLLAARRIAAANPHLTYDDRPPDVLLAIPVLSVDLNGDGSIYHIDVLRYPRQAKDTTQIAIDAVKRAAPFGDVSRLPRPWRFTETFLFNDDRRFKPRTLDDR
ncbi:MAG: hypothetical protein Q7T97_17165 [Burkholderiaceae bacterium]|nr:hypothetical protein [Burkholderiaceae bacterium]